MSNACPRCSNQIAGWVTRDYDGLVYCITCGFILYDPGKKLNDGLLASLMSKQIARWEMIWENARRAKALKV